MLLEYHALKAQDTVLLLNGDVLKGKVSADMGDFYRIDILSRNKFQTVAVDKLDIFSILEQGKPEKVIYKVDSTQGNDFTVSQMRDFMQGERQARLRYKPVLPMIGGVLIGAAGPAIGFWGLALAPVYLGSLAMRKPLPPEKVPESLKIADPEFFTMGYGHTARRVKIQRAAIAALGGLVTAWVISVSTGGLK